MKADLRLGTKQKVAWLRESAQSITVGLNLTERARKPSGPNRARAAGHSHSTRRIPVHKVLTAAKGPKRFRAFLVDEAMHVYTRRTEE